MRGVKTGGRAVDERLLETVEALSKSIKGQTGDLRLCVKSCLSFHVSSRRSQKYNGMYLF